MSVINLIINVGEKKTITFNTKDTYNTENIQFEIQATNEKIDPSNINWKGTSSQFLKADGSIDSNKYQTTISDLATIRRQATNGNAAYGWGNHANAGYITSATLASIRTSPSTIISSTTKWFDRIITNYVLSSTLTANIITNKADIGTILTECLGFECSVFTDIIDFSKNGKAYTSIITSLSKLGINIFIEHDTEDVCMNGNVAILEFNIKNNIIIIKAYRLIN